MENKSKSKNINGISSAIFMNNGSFKSLNNTYENCYFGKEGSIF